MKNKGMTIRAELVETFVEEWTEWRVYRGEPKEGRHIASFKTEREAKAYVRKAA